MMTTSVGRDSRSSGGHGPPEGYTKEEAASLLGIKAHYLAEFAERNSIRVVWRSSQAANAKRLYSREDVDRIIRIQRGEEDAA